MTTYFVRQSGGHDSYSGTSMASAFKTINAALRHDKPGDIIKVMPGTYGPLHIDTNRVTVVFEDGAKVKAPNARHVVLIDADNVTIRGGEFSDSRGGIAATAGADYVSIIDTEIHGIRGNAISGIRGSGYVFQGNTIWGNYGGKDVHSSAISVLMPTDIVGYKPAYAIKIMGNVIYGNGNATPTDGAGIMLDTFEWAPSNADFHGATLIADNTIYDNGGAGIYAYHADDVTIRGNTLLHNGEDPLKPRATEITLNDAQNVKIFKNYARPNDDVTSHAGNDRFVFASVGPEKNTVTFGNNDFGDHHVVAPWSQNYAETPDIHEWAQLDILHW